MDDMEDLLVDVYDARGDEYPAVDVHVIEELSL